MNGVIMQVMHRLIRLLVKVFADVYRQSDNERMGGQNTWYRKQPAEFKLVPGIYRISVLDSSVTPNQKQEILDIEIVSGQTVEKTVAF